MIPESLTVSNFNQGNNFEWVTQFKHVEKIK